MNEVYPGIFLIEEKSGRENYKPSINIYILAGPNGLIFEAGYGDKKSIRKLIKTVEEIKQHYDSEGKKFHLMGVFPSHNHPDHVSGLKQIRKRLNVKIILSRKTADFIHDKKSYFRDFSYDNLKDFISLNHRFSSKFFYRLQIHLMKITYRLFYGLSYIDDPDIIIQNDSELMINNEKWRIIHSPGHASDHISLYNEEKGILFSGDNIIRAITTWLGPYDSNIEQYIESIEHIKQLPNLKLILSAHGDPIENPMERMQELIDHRNFRKKQVLDIIKKGSEKGVSLDDVVNRIYPNSKLLKRSLAGEWIYLTLRMLEKENKIRRMSYKKKTKFRFND